MAQGEQDLRVSGNIAVDSFVRGRNHWTGEPVEGDVTRIYRSDLDDKVYVEVAAPRTGVVQYAIITDVAPVASRCFRPATIDSPRNTGGVPQGTGYRCANCGRTVWFIRDGNADGGERLTHNAVLSERQGF